MQVLVVDDEPLARERLMRMLQEIDFVDAVYSAASGDQALEKSREVDCDVLLLDVRMPGKSGLATAAEIATREDPPAVIFCTAYDEYALDAFRVKAQSYLLKPVEKQALREALQGLTRLNRAQRSSMANEEMPSIPVQQGRNKERIPLSSVLFLRAEQKSVVMVAEQGEYVVDGSLKTLEAKYQQSLLRVHRHTLVNKARVEKLTRDSEGAFWLTIKGFSNRLAVSRRMTKDIRALFDE